MTINEGWQSPETRAMAGERVRLEVKMTAPAGIDEFEETMVTIKDGMALPRGQWAIFNDGIFVSPKELKAVILRWRYP